MNIFKEITILATALFLFNSAAHSQGCSDAGFCTINSLKPHGDESHQPLNHQIKVGFFSGKADNNINVYGNYLEYNRILTKHFSLDTKLTTLGQTGNGISVFGISDLFVNGNYSVADHLNLTLGAKIPLSDGGRSRNNLPLPMDYQASLGTFDLILGIGYQLGRLQMAVATQLPLNQNKNQFTASQYPSGSSLTTFQPTANFKRSGDVLLRFSYPITITPSFRITPSVLPIYHLANDTYTSETGVETEITGSKGLTFNSNIYFDYEINHRHALQLNVSKPFVVRDARPDGLTRSFVANLEYKIRF